MRWEFPGVGLAVTAALACAGCDQLGLGPHQAASSPAPAEPSQAETVMPDLTAHVGDTYSDFVVTASQYAPDELGLPAADRARLWRGMAASAPGEIVTGGGASALVFRGCAETGCADGAAVVAVDTASGAVFAGVRDVGGTEVLAPNERVEALLRLNSPTRSWDVSGPASDVARP